MGVMGTWGPSDLLRTTHSNNENLYDYKVYMHIKFLHNGYSLCKLSIMLNISKNSLSLRVSREEVSCGGHS